MQGTPINWDISPGNTSVLLHPLYQKWATTPIDMITADLPILQADLGFIIPTQENAPIIAYLSWLVRLTRLRA